MEKFTLIFPAFGIDYLGNEDQIITSYSIDVENYFKKAEVFLKTNLNELKKNDNELFTQIDVYIYSCIISDILKKKKLCPSFLAYYSMGIYSALYFSGSITFEYGLYLIKSVYETCLAFIKTKKTNYTMAFIIGLDYNNVMSLIRDDNLEVEITNQNNKYNIILSGTLKDINILMEKAVNEGALKVRQIPTKIPFHSTIIKEAAINFMDKISYKNIKDSKIKIISAYDQKIYQKNNEIIEEIIKNIGNNINWLKTFKKLLSLKNKVFIETGPGESLTKLAKFIDGDFKIFALNKLEQIINNLIFA
ncbi:MAG: ACP S-malonyltransferase [Spirochaetes bacterium]|nr:ACP S-malonyltransferase [Spirochaetota bacterium]